MMMLQSVHAPPRAKRPTSNCGSPPLCSAHGEQRPLRPSTQVDGRGCVEPRAQSATPPPDPLPAWAERGSFRRVSRVGFGVLVLSFTTNTHLSYLHPAARGTRHEARSTTCAARGTRHDVRHEARGTALARTCASPGQR